MPDVRDLLTRWPALDVAARRARLQESLHLSPGPLAEAVRALTPAAERAAGGLWRREPSAWSDEPGVRETIAERLGWLDAPLLMADRLERLQTFAAEVKRAGFTDVVLLGMGGSSLAPEVLRAVLGEAEGWPRLRMLDSTDPAAIVAAETPPARTLYILASKSGTTIEPNALAAHFRQRLEAAGIAGWAQHFVAITDEGTPLAERARAEGFRELFINPSDIGGRYSALTLFGLVPAALMGQDIVALVGWGAAMLVTAEPGFGQGVENPAVGLGLAIAAAAREGRDKLTLLLPAALAPLGLWIEQLVAESTGKQGIGVVPIAGEAAGAPSDYGADRFFVRVVSDEAPSAGSPDSRGLVGAGAPVAMLSVPEPAALGAEFMRWEIATTIAGALLGVNPFDEPNVQQAKDATRDLLDRYKTDRRLPVHPPDRTTPEGVALTLSAAAKRGLRGAEPEAVLALVRPGDYVAILAYLGPDPRLADELSALRTGARKRTGAATMFGYGPRYLHSTGQLHKGGPNTGVFVLITATPAADIQVPGAPFSFGVLELAQAVGDFASLDAAGRRVLHVHLPTPDQRLLEAVADALIARAGGPASA
jgi:glucose-6-phosphate isomerase